MVSDVQDVFAHIYEESQFSSELRHLSRPGANLFLEALAALNIELILFTSDNHEIFEDYISSIDKLGVVTLCVAKHVAKTVEVPVCGLPTKVKLRDVRMLNR